MGSLFKNTPDETALVYTVLMDPDEPGGTEAFVELATLSERLTAELGGRDASRNPEEERVVAIGGVNQLLRAADMGLELERKARRAIVRLEFRGVVVKGAEESSLKRARKVLKGLRGGGVWVEEECVEAMGEGHQFEDLQDFSGQSAARLRKLG